MRISIPNIVIANASPAGPPVSPAQAIERLVNFLSPSINGKGTALLTGAGISVDSGIRACKPSGCVICSMVAQHYAE